MPSFPSQALACKVAHPKLVLRAKLPIARCHHVPCCPSQGGIVCLRFLSQGAIVWHDAHRKVQSCAEFIMSSCHRVATLPIMRCHGRLPHGSPVCQVSRLMEPSCSYVPHVKVSSCAYVPHVKVPSHVSNLLIANVLILVIAWFNREPSYPPPYAKVAKSWCHRVPSCPSQGAILCQVAHRKVLLRAKLPITSHCVPSCLPLGAIVCQVAYH